MTDTTDTADVYAKVEQNGHRTFYGRITEITRFGVTLVRIEVPGREKPVDIAPSSIFAITECTKEQAERGASRSHETIPSWEIGESRPAIAGHDAHALPAGGDPEDADFEDENDDDLSY
jgi:hypothetical protein